MSSSRRLLASALRVSRSSCARRCTYRAAGRQTRPIRTLNEGRRPTCERRPSVHARERGFADSCRDKRSTLLPLKYFPADPTTARAGGADSCPTSGRSSRCRRRPARVARCSASASCEFTLKGQKLQPRRLRPGRRARSRQLFVPFADTTTGTETYAAGRYLDLEPTATGLYTIDFNYAYNPYCAYNKAYECPYPPPSNRLKVPIRAGEKAPARSDRRCRRSSSTSTASSPTASRCTCAPFSRRSAKAASS